MWLRHNRIDREKRQSENDPKLPVIIFLGYLCCSPAFPSIQWCLIVLHGRFLLLYLPLLYTQNQVVKDKIK
jgi:hypothetical protein